MTPDRWRQVEQLLHAALECDPSARAAFLERECNGDLALREEVESLLASSKGTHSFLEAGALEDATVLLQDSNSDGRMTGSNFGPYSIRELIGSGGMGEVYLAEDNRLGRKIALKLLNPVLLADKVWRVRFLREARLASGLDHPNICTVYEVGEIQDQPFIAMQYVEGDTLKRLVSQRRLSLKSVISIGLQVADALALAHQKGVIHRDIKSANILITPRGQAKVLDFGLAKSLEQTELEKSTSLTMTGEVMGTPAFMSPEQARGEPVDQRSDIFSFGIVLYEMATGRTPFNGTSKADVISSMLKDRPVPAAEINRQTPQFLSSIIDRALEKSAAKRYQSIVEMTRDLQRIASEHGITAAPSTIAEPKIRRLRALIQRLTGGYKTPVLAGFACLLVTAVALSFGYFWRRQPSNAPPPPATIRSIAILPFKPLVSGERDESLEMGIADTLIARLSSIREIEVRPISAVRKYETLEQDALAAGREQKVDAVLDGSIQKSGDRIRVRVRLVNVGDGSTLLTDTFDDRLADIFSVEDSISERVAGTLALKLSGEERALVAQHDTNNPEAYQLYLKGRYFWNKRTGEAIQRSIDYLNQAIEKDPDYAKAYAALADSYTLLSNYNVTTPKEAYSKARAAATEALKRNDKLAEAHNALANVMASYDWDFAGAEREFKRSIALNPNYANAHQGYGEFLGAMGRSTEALNEMKRAQELEPLSLIINTDLASQLYFAGRFDESIDQVHKTLDLDSSFGRAHIELGFAYRLKRQYDAAISEFKRALEIDREDSYALSQLAHTYGLMGRRDEAHKILDQMKALSKRQYVLPSDMAASYAGLGEKDQAFEWLEKAYSDRDDGIPFLKIDPSWDPLRSDPRFTDLLHRIGFPQ